MEITSPRSDEVERSDHMERVVLSSESTSEEELERIEVLNSPASCKFTSEDSEERTSSKASPIDVFTSIIDAEPETREEFFLEIEPEVREKVVETPIELRTENVKTTTFRIMEKTDTFEMAMRLRHADDNNTIIRDKSGSSSDLSYLQLQEYVDKPDKQAEEVLLEEVKQKSEYVLPVEEEDNDLENTWARIEIQTEKLQIEAAQRPAGKIIEPAQRIINYSEAKLYFCEQALDVRILEDLSLQKILTKRGFCKCGRQRSLREIPGLPKTRQPEIDRIHCLIRQSYDATNNEHRRMILAIFQKLTGNMHPPLTRFPEATGLTLVFRAVIPLEI